jgi:hypothetical protein
MIIIVQAYQHLASFLQLRQLQNTAPCFAKHSFLILVKMSKMETRFSFHACSRNALVASSRGGSLFDVG